MPSSSKVVLITGCSQGGIGYSLCEAYAAQGCIVYATARKLESMNGFVDSNIHILKLDVTEDKDVEDVIKTIIEREGRIDILVNNAGSAAPGPILDMTIDQARRAFELNTFSVLRVSKAVARHMAKRKCGTIVLIGSIAAHFPTPWSGMYAATKAAAHQIMDTLWMECKPLGIEVVTIAPGAIRSNIAKNALPLLQVPEDTLYPTYTPQILKRLNASQTIMGPMPTNDFARKVVRETVKKDPTRYMTLGGGAFLCKISLWLPRTWVLGFFWRKFSKL